jgi:hypothetical protein
MGCSSRRGKGRRYVMKRKRMCYVRMEKRTDQQSKLLFEEKRSRENIYREK